MKIFNFVIYGSGNFFGVAYDELNHFDDVLYLTSIQDVLKSGFGKMLYRITFSPRLNSIISLPFKNLTFKAISSVRFNSSRPICFIFFSNQYHLFNNGYLEYLKQRFPACKVVLYLQDLVKINIQLNIPVLKNKFDLILSYDKGDCAKYNLLYHPTPYSKIDIKSSENYPICDVFFCGKAKTRFDTIYKVYKKLAGHGLNCCFIIVGLPEEQQINSPGLIYCDGISYLDNIRYELKAKCLLEIMQEEATGFTPRLWEAIMYDKHLLTNNSSVITSEYYVKEYHHSLEEIENVEKWINKEVVYSDEQKRALSPSLLLKKIEAFF